jgi:hypothetical protein
VDSQCGRSFLIRFYALVPPFDDPIPLPDGGEIETLSDARAYILKLGKKDQQADEWQAAIAALIMAAEGKGPMDHARIGVLRAMNRHKPRLFDPSPKDPHWSNRS